MENTSKPTADQTDHEFEKLRLKLVALELENAHLKHERQQFIRFSNQTPPMITILHGPEHIVVVSNWAMRLLMGNGNNRSEPIRDVHPELAGQGLFEKLDQVYNTGKPFFGNTVPIKFNRPQYGYPEERYINFVYQPQKNISGQVENVIILAFDVTESARKVEKLRRGQAALLSFPPATTQIAWIAGPTGIVETYSPNWYFYTGLSEENSLALNGWQRIVHPQDQERCEKEWRTWLLDGQEYQSVFRLKESQTGLYHWFSGRTVAIRDKQGRLQHWFGTLTNVDQHLQPDKIRDETTQRAQKLIASKKLGVLISGADGLIYEANALALANLGYQREELIGGEIRLKDLFPAGENEIDSVVDRILHEQDSYEPRQRTLLTRDGRLLTVLVGGTLLDSRRELVVLLLQVVSDRPSPEAEKQPLAAQFESEQARFKAVMENIPVGTILVEAPGGKILLSNSHLDQLIRRPISEGQNLKDYIEHLATYADGSPLTAESSPLTRALNGELVRGDEILYQHSDGTKSWLRVSANPVLDHSGNIIGGTVAVVDFDKEKRAEERLRFLSDISKGLFASLDYEATLQNVAHLIVPFLADWCIIDVLEQNGNVNSMGTAHQDPQREKLVRELSRRYWSEFNQPDHYVMRVLKTGKPLTQFKYSEAPVMPAYNPEHQKILQLLGLNSLMVIPLTNHGQILGALTLVMARPGRYYQPADFELAEEFARRAGVAIENARSYQAARTAIKNRDDFLSVASHELKTPLTGIRGYAQLLMRQYDNGGEFEAERLRMSLDAIDRQAEKVTHLMAQLLDFTRIETGHLTIAPLPTDLVSLVQSVIETIRVSHLYQELEFRSPEQAEAMIDPVRFEQVVINLLDNAIKFSPQGGPIELEIGEAGRFITLSITDHGIGVPVEHRPHIFERFYQAHEGNDLKGLGLGLHISAEIIALHEGQLVPEFPEEGGTRFVIKLPRFGL